MAEYIVAETVHPLGTGTQQEIIGELVRCKDCKHWREGTVYLYCDKLFGMGVLDAYDYMTDEDDYCSRAERKTDEKENI